MENFSIPTRFQEVKFEDIELFIRREENQIEVVIPENKDFPEGSRKCKATGTIYGHSLRIGNLHTLRKYERLGLAKTVLNYLMSLPEIEEITLNSDKEAEGFYLKLGFLKSDPSNPKDTEYYWRKELVGDKML